MLILLIYILGIIATLYFIYHTIDSRTEVTLIELSFIILVSGFSWLAFIIAILIIYGDKTVFKKK